MQERHPRLGLLGAVLVALGFVHQAAEAREIVSGPGYSYHRFGTGELQSGAGGLVMRQVGPAYAGVSATHYTDLFLPRRRVNVGLVVGGESYTDYQQGRLYTFGVLRGATRRPLTIFTRQRITQPGSDSELRANLLLLGRVRTPIVRGFFFGGLRVDARVELLLSTRVGYEGVARPSGRSGSFTAACTLRFTTRTAVTVNVISQGRRVGGGTLVDTTLTAEGQGVAGNWTETQARFRLASSPFGLREEGWSEGAALLAEKQVP